jgi:hypothetical protein
MAQDLRDLLKQEKERKYAMKHGHEERFAARLDQAMPATGKPRLRNYMIAASLLLVFGIGVALYLTSGNEIQATDTVVQGEDKADTKPNISLGDLSPDLKKIEQYYVSTINMELSEIEISDDNKAMVDGYMERLAQLNKEYLELNKELNTIGPNDQTIAALIRNLQLRLELLYKLNDQLNSLKSSENETVSSQSI